MKKSKRRRFSKEFKEEAVKLVTESGYRVSEAARNLGIDPNLLSKWKRELLEAKEEQSSTHALQEELQRLRKENKQLKMEREILKKATAFFVKEQG